MNDNFNPLIDDCIYIDKNGDSHQIYPMKLKDSSKVSRLFLKIDDTYLYLNLPTPKLDKKGNIVLDKKTKEPIMDTSSYDAMLELFELALKEPREQIEEWVDLQNGVQILDEFRQVSGLKKNLTQKMMEQILLPSSQQ